MDSIPLIKQRWYSDITNRASDNAGYETFPDFCLQTKNFKLQLRISLCSPTEEMVRELFTTLEEDRNWIVKSGSASTAFTSPELVKKVNLDQQKVQKDKLS